MGDGEGGVGREKEKGTWGEPKKKRYSPVVWELWGRKITKQPAKKDWRKDNKEGNRSRGVACVKTPSQTLGKGGGKEPTKWKEKEEGIDNSQDEHRSKSSDLWEFGRSSDTKIKEKGCRY